MARKKLSLKGIRTFEELKAALAKRAEQSAKSRAERERIVEEEIARQHYLRSLHVKRRGPIIRAKRAGVPAAKFVSGGRVESNRRS